MSSWFQPVHEASGLATMSGLQASFPQSRRGRMSPWHGAFSWLWQFCFCRSEGSPALWGNQHRLVCIQYSQTCCCVKRTRPHLAGPRHPQRAFLYQLMAFLCNLHQPNNQEATLSTPTAGKLSWGKGAKLAVLRAHHISSRLWCHHFLTVGKSCSGLEQTSR